MKLMLRTVLVVILLSVAGFALPQAVAPEYNVKAAFLFNFAQFVTWPEEAFEDKNAPLVVGILGEDPFGGYLDQTVSSETVNGHPLEVRRYTDATQAADAHILFVNLPRQDKLDKALKDLKGHPVLTVGDTQSFARSGGMIRFYTENNRIRLRVNLDEVKAADLAISAKLLKLAVVVQNGKVQ